MIANRTEYRVFRLCAMAWLLGWLVKIWYFFPYLRYHIFMFPVTAKQFPEFFLNNNVALIAYHLPIVCLFFLFIEKRVVLLFIASIMLACTTVLGLHIDTYNDMTFISSFWVALWLLWFAYNINDRAHIVRHAPYLAQCIIGLLFLGGTVGKLTPEYWSGEAFYNLVVRETPGPFGLYLLEHYSVETQKVIMAYVSKAIIVSEALLAIAPVYPYRLFCGFGIFTVAMLVVFRNVQILSVLACLAGMALACLLLIPARER